ncbi:MAG: hypothetical protein ACRD0Q_05980 [Acidimicrobiales bacterium]
MRDQRDLRGGDVDRALLDENLGGLTFDAGEHPGPLEATVEVRSRGSFGYITIRRADVAVSEQGAT